jgi:hypothetical protein
VQSSPAHPSTLPTTPFWTIPHVREHAYSLYSTPRQFLRQTAE